MNQPKLPSATHFGRVAEPAHDAERRYTIESLVQDDLGDGRSVEIPMVFRDRETALENARALMKAGIGVVKVKGPNFEIGETALRAFFRSQSS